MYICNIFVCIYIFVRIIPNISVSTAVRQPLTITEQKYGGLGRWASMFRMSVHEVNATKRPKASSES